LMDQKGFKPKAATKIEGEEGGKYESSMAYSSFEV
jgi:hypothetical protein